MLSCGCTGVHCALHVALDDIFYKLCHMCHEVCSAEGKCISNVYADCQCFKVGISRPAGSTPELCSMSMQTQDGMRSFVDTPSDDSDPYDPATAHSR